MPEKVAIQHEDGRRFGEWPEIEVQLGLDTYRAVSLTGPFDPDRQDMRESFEPLSFPAITVTIGDELVLTGRVKDVSPNVDATQSSVCVTAYSTAHDLTEICAAPELLPLEFNNLDLKQIAQHLAGASLGLVVNLDGSPGARFPRVRCHPDDNLHDFLAEVARQRGFVMADTPSGDLAFLSEGPLGSPVARLQGQPLGRVSAQFNPSKWYSHITGRACKRSGQQHGSKYTQKNKLYRSIFPRHTCSIVGDTGSADVPRATNAMVGRMIASAATYTVEDLPTWRDPSGKLWTPNKTITITAPGAMIYKETELLIRAVKLTQRADEERATLELVLPGSFGGTVPQRLPWDF